MMNIEKELEQIAKRNGIEHFEISDADSQYCGTYGNYDRSITIYKPAIIRNAEANNWDYESALRCTFAHEMGHATDPDYDSLKAKRQDAYASWDLYCKSLMQNDPFRYRNAEREIFHDLNTVFCELNIQLEINARDYGLNFIPDGLREMYENDNGINLYNYYVEHEKLKRTEKLFQLKAENPSSKSHSELMAEYKEIVSEVMSKVYGVRNI